MTRWCAALALALAAAGQTVQAQPAARPPVQDFVAPAPGSYALPVIQDGADGWVLERNWLPRRLAAYTHGAITLLSFVYTYCSDPIGCPLAYATFDAVKRQVIANPTLRGRVRLVSLSFDPGNDTPDAMQAYGGANARDDRVPWFFLTTYSTAFLAPILDGFGQDVEVERDADGKPTRMRAHMLKVFLLDARGRVREIYSAAFLQPQVIVNDIKTLALETRGGSVSTAQAGSR